jgi:hypothetical protein
MADTPAPRSRCRHVNINGTRCTRLALPYHDGCADHDFQHTLAVIRRNYVPGMAPGVPLVTGDADVDLTALRHGLSSIMTAFANGNLTPGQSIRMNAFLRTCGNTTRAISDAQRLAASLASTQAPDH